MIFLSSSPLLVVSIPSFWQLQMCYSKLQVRVSGIPPRAVLIRVHPCRLSQLTAYLQIFLVSSILCTRSFALLLHPLNPSMTSVSFCFLHFCPYFLVCGATYGNIPPPPFVTFFHIAFSTIMACRCSFGMLLTCMPLVVLSEHIPSSTLNSVLCKNIPILS